jgi:hypothetical protein
MVGEGGVVRFDLGCLEEGAFELGVFEWSAFGRRGPICEVKRDGRGGGV